MQHKGVFVLVDCNNFFASCEAVFNPKILGKPVVVLSNNDGCIIARSNKAKDLGIKMGEPFFKRRRFLKGNNVFYFSANFSLYKDMSNRVMSVLSRFSSNLEVYSIDEAFLFLDKGFVKSLDEYGRRIKNTIKTYTGIPVSVGIGPTKTLAKVANTLAKKDKSFNGVLSLTCENLDEFLKRILVEDVWGIGRNYAKVLNENKICTALDLKNAPDCWVRKTLTINGFKTVLELRGVSCLPIVDEINPNKHIMYSRSFGKPITLLSDLKEVVAFFTARAAEKLRSQNLFAKSISVYIRTSRFEKRFYSNVSSVKLANPTFSTPVLVSYAHRALEKIYKPNFKYKKAGVILLDTSSTRNLQLSMYKPRKDESLMRTIDLVNKKWGRGVIRFASEGLEKPWKGNKKFCSPCYTTKWSDIPVVKPLKI